MKKKVSTSKSCNFPLLCFMQENLPPKAKKMMLSKHLWSCPRRTDRISELPKDILHRILYFLSQEDAVRTSVLSKSWRYTWCSRPNLDFSDQDFRGNMKHRFISVVDSNLQRYRDRNLSLEEFRLSVWVYDSDDSLYRELVRLLEKWIPLAATMGVKKFRLSFRTSYYNAAGGGYVIVKQLSPVVFGAETLHDLHLGGFVVDRKAIERMVPFNHLRVLRLELVSIEDEVFQQIISSCHLTIETVDLKSCRGLRNIKVKDLRNLKSFSFSGCTSAAEHESCSIEIHSLSLRTIEIWRGDVRFEKGSDFRNLKDLDIHCVRSSWEHLSSCKFPSLKHLTLWNCYGLEEVNMFIDAPNVHLFTYSGETIPSISFATTTSRRWRSLIFLKYLPANDASSWFIKLNELLKSLSQSSIKLKIDGYSSNNEDDMHLAQDIGGCSADKLVVVESLYLSCHSSSLLPSLLNRAFSICRPRVLVVERRWKIDDVECMWKVLMERDQSRHDRLWLQDLEEVRMEILEWNRVGWRRISLSELPRYKKNVNNKVRFALKWREPASENIPGETSSEHQITLSELPNYRET